MKILHELASSRNEKIKLQAALRMSDILMQFEQSQERLAIATERAAARKAEAEDRTRHPQPDSTPETAVDPMELWREIETHLQGKGGSNHAV